MNEELPDWYLSIEILSVGGDEKKGDEANKISLL
jgi:hypothetical protein